MSRFPESARSDISMKTTVGPVAPATSAVVDANSIKARKKPPVERYHAAPSAAAAAAQDDANNNNNNRSSLDDDYEDEVAVEEGDFRSELRRVADAHDIPISALVRRAAAAGPSSSSSTSGGAAAVLKPPKHHERPSNLSTEDGAATGSATDRPGTPNSVSPGGGYGTINGSATATTTTTTGSASNLHASPGVAALSSSTDGIFGGGQQQQPSPRRRLPRPRVVKVDLSDLMMNLDGADGFDYYDDGGSSGGHHHYNGDGGGLHDGAVDAYGNGGDGDDVFSGDGGGPVLTHMSGATMGASSVGAGSASERGDQPLLMGDKPKPKKRGVRFHTGEELEKVIFYEVDNSIYMRIEYRRPIFGWLCLTVALLAQSAQLTTEEYFVREGVSPYASAMWTSLGQLVLMSFLVLSYLAACHTGGLAVGAFRYSVMMQVAVAGLMYTLVGVSRQANSKMSRTARQLTASALHPLLICMFGLVFRNTVFLEEVAGIVVFIAGFATAMMQRDIEIQLWGFAEVVALSGAIYTASMLFTLVKARAASVAAPVLALSCSCMSFFVQLLVAPASTSPYGSNPHNSYVGFADSHAHWVAMLLSALFATAALISFIKALQYLPPITVSVAIALSPILAIFFTKFLADPVSSTARQEGKLFTLEFSIGATVTVMAAIYVLYISSIKRQRVDMLMRSLSRRRKPKDPYNKPGNSGQSGSSGNNNNNNSNMHGGGGNIGGGNNNNNNNNNNNTTNNDDDDDDDDVESDVRDYRGSAAPTTTDAVGDNNTSHSKLVAGADGLGSAPPSSSTQSPALRKSSSFSPSTSIEAGAAAAASAGAAGPVVSSSSSATKSPSLTFDTNHHPSSSSSSSHHQRHNSSGNNNEFVDGTPSSHILGGAGGGGIGGGGSLGNLSTGSGSESGSVTNSARNSFGAGSGSAGGGTTIESHLNRRTTPRSLQQQQQQQQQQPLGSGRRHSVNNAAGRRGSGGGGAALMDD